MDYKFSSPSKKCSMCNGEFQEQEKFTSLLKYSNGEVEQNSVEKSTKKKGKKKSKAEDATVEFSRLDLCQKCWEKFEKKDILSWWIMRKEQRKKLPALKDAEFLWQLLFQANRLLTDTPGAVPRLSVQSNEIETVEENTLLVEAEHFAYIAALGLLRLKQLKMKEYKNIDDNEYLVFTTSQHSTIEVKNPKLDVKALEELEKKIESMSSAREEI